MNCVSVSALIESLLTRSSTLLNRIFRPIHTLVSYIHCTAVQYSHVQSLKGWSVHAPSEYEVGKLLFGCERCHDEYGGYHFRTARFSHAKG